MKDNEADAIIIGALLDIKAQLDRIEAHTEERLNRIEAALTQQYPQIDPTPLGYQQTEKAQKHD